MALSLAKHPIVLREEIPIVGAGLMADVGCSKSKTGGNPALVVTQHRLEACATKEGLLHGTGLLPVFFWLSSFRKMSRRIPTSRHGRLTERTPSAPILAFQSRAGLLAQARE